MIFTPCPLAGVWVVDPERHTDERGFFARSFCAQTFAEASLEAPVAQCSISWNSRRGTLRGMHWQTAPHDEAKLVRCTRGAVYDVVVDLRPESATYRQWHALELNADNRRMLYIPRGLAHGFLTLADDTEVFYQMSTHYEATASRGARWDDPSFGIRWPESPRVISTRDRTYPDFRA